MAEEPGTSCGDELKGAFVAIKKRNEALDAREEKIRVEEERLKTLKGEVEKRIAEFGSLRADLDKIYSDIKSAKESNMKDIAKIYENMPAEEAATRLEQLEDDLAVRLLKSMNSRIAGKVLAFVEPAKAAKLTEVLGKDPLSHGL